MRSVEAVAAVPEAFYGVVEEAAREAYVMALKDIPPDVRDGLRNAIATESDARARTVMETMLAAVELGDRGMMVCQDTGIPVYWVRIGTAAYVDGGRLRGLIERAVRRATLETPFRSSIVNPTSRENRQDSTGEGVPVLHFDFVPGSDRLELLMMPKGSGAENWSFLKMLVPADGDRGIREFVLESVLAAGGMACPPLVVGVGVGGTSDQCLAIAKEATLRPVGARHPDPKLAQQQALRALDRLAVADRRRPDNRVAYGQGGPASFDYSMTAGVGGNGGMAFGDASFGNLYAAYVNHLRDRLNVFWNREYRDPSLPAGRLVYIRFSVDRGGHISGIGFAQPSNVPALDSRALHAVQVLAESERLPLPADYPRSTLDVRVSFELQ